MEKVENPGLGCYSRLFLVQVSEGWRLVIDLSSLNNIDTLIRFRLESVLLVLGFIRKMDILFS